MAARARAALTAVTLAAGLIATVGEAAAQDAVFRGSVEAVRLDVAVTRGARNVDGLTPSQFEVRDNGVLQTIDTVSRDEMPLSLMLVLDVSGSMAGERLAALVDAAQGLVRSLRPDDRVGVLSFSQQLVLHVAPTVTHARALEALRHLSAGGPTALRDALFAGLQMLEPDPDWRPALVLFSDGRDTASWLARAELADVVRRSGVVVHAVELLDRDLRGRPVSNIAATESVHRALDAGGGRLWSAASPRDLASLFSDALNELRGRYLISYHPTGPAVPGWHQVEVRLKGSRGDVRARPGYFVP
jgi:Ca-activated chloride channel homolog